MRFSDILRILDMLSGQQQIGSSTQFENVSKKFTTKSEFFQYSMLGH